MLLIDRSCRNLSKDPISNQNQVNASFLQILNVHSYASVTQTGASAFWVHDLSVHYDRVSWMRGFLSNQHAKYERMDPNEKRKNYTSRLSTRNQSGSCYAIILSSQTYWKNMDEAKKDWDSVRELRCSQDHYHRDFFLERSSSWWDRNPHFPKAWKTYPTFFLVSRIINIYLLPPITQYSN